LATFSYEGGVLSVDKKGNVVREQARISNSEGVKNAHSQKDLLDVYKKEAKAAI
jgi:hypothetical protein